MYFDGVERLYYLNASRLWLSLISNRMTGPQTVSPNLITCTYRYSSMAIIDITSSNYYPDRFTSVYHLAIACIDMYMYNGMSNI